MRLAYCVLRIYVHYARSCGCGCVRRMCIAYFEDDTPDLVWVQMRMALLMACWSCGPVASSRLPCASSRLRVSLDLIPHSRALRQAHTTPAASQGCAPPPLGPHSLTGGRVVTQGGYAPRRISEGSRTGRQRARCCPVRPCSLVRAAPVGHARRAWARGRSLRATPRFGAGAPPRHRPVDICGREMAVNDQRGRRRGRTERPVV